MLQGTLQGECQHLLRHTVSFVVGWLNVWRGGVLAQSLGRCDPPGRVVPGEKQWQFSSAAAIPTPFAGIMHSYHTNSLG